VDFDPCGALALQEARDAENLAHTGKTTRENPTDVDVEEDLHAIF
jgi:hypothetical protein